MSWRLAKSLAVLIRQVNETFPLRDKSWDGTIGDQAHSARTSDHNPASDGLVHACDITHDPRHGLDSQKLAEALKAAEDPRVSYIISNRKIWNPQVSPEWRSYNGSNPHDHHVHISVKNGPREDDESPWNLGITPEAVALKPELPPVPPVPKTVRKGSSGAEVKMLWALLEAAEPDSFGPILEAATKAYQKSKGLDADGVAGPVTWTSLKNGVKK